MTTGILGCALVAGLMTFASDKAQAGVVSGGQLYSPLKIKMTGYYIKDSKITKMTVSSKDVLKDLGYDTSKRQLAVSRNSGDVWVLNKTNLVKDISVTNTDFLFVNLSPIVWTTKGTTYTEAGTTSVNFYDGGFNALGTDSANWFETSGVYSYKDNDGKPSKGFYLDHESYSAPALSGNGHFTGLGNVPITGSASYNGSGKLED